MRLAPWELAWNYIQRSGRVDMEKLKGVSPKFVEGYQAFKAGNAGQASAQAPQ
jgi:hypothetical protein